MSDFVLNFKAPDVNTKGVLGLFHAFEDVQAAAAKLQKGEIPTRAQMDAIINAACVLVEEGQRDAMRDYLMSEATIKDLITMTSTITSLTNLKQ